MEHYENDPAAQETKRPEEREAGWSRVLCVVGISFGLLCIAQTALNVALRLRAVGCSNRSDPTYNATQDRERLLDENKRLKNQIQQQQQEISELHREKQGLLIKLLEGKPKACPSGWQQSMSSCYQVSRGRNTWSYAKNDCEQKGAQLVTIDDPYKQDFIHAFFRLETVWVNIQQGRRRCTLMTSYGDGGYYCHYSKQSQDGVTTRHGAGRKPHPWVCERELKVGPYSGQGTFDLFTDRN